MRAQGYEISQNILFQDNQSTMRLLINGKHSSGKRTKWIDVKYFFATDVINRGDMIVEYCPTEEMWADILTKPLQGAPFGKMRSVLMNMPEHYVDPDKKAGTNSSIRSTGTGVQDTEIAGVRTQGTKKVRFTKPITRAQKKTPRKQKAKPLTSVRRSVLRTTKSDGVRPPYKQVLIGNKNAPMTKGKSSAGDQSK